MSDTRKNFAIAEILPLCTDSEMTSFAIIRMDQRKFPNASVQSFINLKECQKSNEEECLRKILKGESATLPPQDPVVAMAESQKRAMIELVQPIQDVKINLVVDTQDNDVKGYRFHVDEVPLEKWCETNRVPFDKYQAGLQAYAEVDVLKPMNMAIINDQLIEMDDVSGESKILTYDEFTKKMNAQSNSRNAQLEKKMKSDSFIQKDAKVHFLVEPFGTTEKLEKQAVQEQPRAGLDSGV